MKLLDSRSEQIIRKEYAIELEDGSNIFRVEFENEKGKVIDFITMDLMGNEIDDPAFNELIDEFLESIENQTSVDPS
jgi:hypothetical protein